MAGSLALPFTDVFGERSSTGDYLNKPLFVGVLPDLSTPAAIALGKSLVRKDEEINANRYALLMFALKGDLFAYMGSSGFNSPLGTVTPADLRLTAFRGAANGVPAVFVVHESAVVFEKLGAKPQDFQLALEEVRSLVGAAPAQAGRPTAASLAPKLQAIVEKLEQAPADGNDLAHVRELMLEATSVMHDGEENDVDALAELHPLLERLSAALGAD